MQWLARHRLFGHLIAFASGALAVLSLSPFDLWPLALLSLALFYLGLRPLSPKQAFFCGWFYGFGLFLAGVHWVYVSIHDYGAASPLLAGFLTLAFCAGLAFLLALTAFIWVRWLRLNRSPVIDALAFAALWTLQEMLRSGLLGGFPWLYLGYSQLGAPLAGLFPLGGVWLASFVLALSAALFTCLPCLRRRPLLLIAALCLLVTPWLGGWWLKGHQWTQPTGSPLSVAAVQGNVPQQLKWEREQLQAQLDLYADLTRHARQTDLVVWPETAVPVLKEYIEPYLAQMAAFSHRRRAALMTGVPLREDGRYYNAVMTLGEGQGTYLKQKLVPFGEYVPLEQLLRGLITFFDLPMSSFSAGAPNQPPLNAKGTLIAPLICYEVVYPLLAAGGAARSHLLLTLSNDTWFGRSIGPWQHLQMARARALESGRAMIRATNNGVTALIDPFGEITAQIPQFEQALLYGQVQPMQGLTPWLSWGHWPLLVLCALMVTVAAITRHFKLPSPA
ncbi:apolipoprotein N-acyltransferase [Ventosimonas gracilis]|uniref:Apolipoprotein N-acyltransferase n=1 Tax=Ventosimonas gracilis TaxID=1680762 RepID=A0A139SX37_9GAMM|nr:apolipoprotein N-acyltransferase [Ventosimonas gracilis]KXU39183.1 apolipoprotein N-acyltransferase [Ventosimonas gracilis]